MTKLPARLDDGLLEFPSEEELAAERPTLLNLDGTLIGLSQRASKDGLSPFPSETFLIVERPPATTDDEQPAVHANTANEPLHRFIAMLAAVFDKPASLRR